MVDFLVKKMWIFYENKFFVQPFLILKNKQKLNFWIQSLNPVDSRKADFRSIE